MKISEARKYLDAAARLLDPRFREIEPSDRDLGCSTGVVKGIDADARTLTAVVSTPNPDRYEEIVEPRAFKEWLPVFMKNPVFVAGHTYGGRSGEPTVIGHWTAMQVADDGLIGTAKFARTALAEQYWQLYAEGHMRAFSVGWLTHQWEMREYEVAPGVSKKIRVFTEVELIEVSAVAIPANRESLVRAASALSRGQVDADGPLLKAIEDAVARAFRAQGEILRGAAVELKPIETRGVEAAVRDAITKTLTDPDGPVDSLIREVVAAVHAHGSCGHDDDLDAPGTEPGRGASERQGANGEIVRQLEATLAAIRR